MPVGNGFVRNDRTLRSRSKRSAPDSRDGSAQIFSHQDMLARWDGYMARFPKFETVARHYICEGPYVTLVWDIHMAEKDGPTTSISSIEIFKVVDGVITDVWNPNEVAESYPRGPWPALTK